MEVPFRQLEFLGIPLLSGEVMPPNGMEHCSLIYFCVFASEISYCFGFNSLSRLLHSFEDNPIQWLVGGQGVQNRVPGVNNLITRKQKKKWSRAMDCECH